MSQPIRRAVTVRAPATSANLGPGYDTLGLALGLHDVVDVAVEFGSATHPPQVTVSVEGVGADDVPRDESHLVARAVLAGFAELGMKPSTVLLTCQNSIPQGRGMGSSAAAIVAGVVAARALSGAGTVTSDEGLLDLAGRLEGHPDNVAPCLLGGLTIAWTGDDHVTRATRLDVHPDVRPILCIPPTSLSTHAARGLLPATVPHSDAARNAARAALLVDAVTRRPELLFVATEDRLHQAYREPAMPATLALVAFLRERGLPAVVSGAGPSVLVLARGDEATELTPELEAGWTVRSLPVDAAGAVVEESAVSGTGAVAGGR